MSAVWTVFGKEMLDGLRDRRSLISALLYPLIGPLLIGVMFTAIIDQATGSDAVVLPVEGAEHGPALVEYLRTHGVDVVSAPADPEQAVAEHAVSMTLVIPEDYAERFRSSKTAEVRLVVDGSRNDVRSDVGRVQALVQGYGSQVGAMRLIARGVSPEVVQAVVVAEVDVATEQERSASLLNFVPMFVIMAAFIGGMQVAIDATAGERERKSLEPLLITPASRQALVLGKWLAASVFGVVGVVLTFLFCVLVLRYLPLEELGLRLAMGPREVVGVLAASVPLAPMAVGMQMLVGTFARSFKEAQTYTSLLIFLPLTPGMLLTFYPLDSSGWVSLVPALGQQLLLADALGGEPGGVGPYVGAGALALALGLVCVAVTARMFERERVVFGR